MELASIIEHTLLSPRLTALDITKLAKEAKEFSFHGICIPPFWIKAAKREVDTTSIKIISVISFPFGYSRTETKLKEAALAIRDGADELDCVMCLSAFRTNPNWVKVEWARLAQYCHEQEVFFKVILETALLSKEEIVQACQMAEAAGVDFIKTSTGIGAGASVEAVKLIRSVCSTGMGIKASGGIKTRASAIALVEAGADRIGSSAGVQLLKA